MGHSARYPFDMPDPAPEPESVTPTSITPTSETTAIESALPSVRARIIAFAAIIAGGIIGAVIGYRFMTLQCTGSCSVPQGLGMTTGTLVGAIGFAVISVLSLRAVAEWNR